MPLPNDERIVKLADELVAQLKTMFGSHPGMRPAHARGRLVRGVFKPSGEAAAISKAPHFANAETPITVRFSNSTGLPLIPDTDPNANPRGMALRFHLAPRVHTDIICHSANGFPTRTGEEFLEFLKAAAGPAGAINAFLASHPNALRFAQLPKPHPASYASEAYFGVTALEFENSEGRKRFGRYRIVPEGQVEHVEVDGRGPDYLIEELKGRLSRGPVFFDLKLQVAGPEDVVDDASQPWPESNGFAELGRIELRELVEDDAAEQKHVIFDPIPRVDGIGPSPDPLLELRAAVYLISGRMRRSA